jgi:hypothetical protein
MAVQVQASFKKDQKHLDGLDHVRKDLIDAPLQPRIIVAVIDVAQITHDVLDGSDTPKIRLRQVEVLDGPDAMKAVDMLNRQYQRRTGREDSQASLFDEWDPGASSATKAPTEIDEQAAEALERLEARRAETAQFIGEQGPELTDLPGVPQSSLDYQPGTTDEELQAEAEDNAQADADDNDEGDDGVPWIPDAPEQAAAGEDGWPGDAPAVEFSEPVEGEQPKRASRRRDGKR